MEQKTDYVSAVNGVISICKDAQEGFHGAANAVEDPVLKSMFEEYSTQRGQFAHELAVKGAFTGHSAHEILEETERGEDLSVKRYRQTLDNSGGAERTPSNPQPPGFRGRQIGRYERV